LVARTEQQLKTSREQQELFWQQQCSLRQEQERKHREQATNLLELQADRLNVAHQAQLDEQRQEQTDALLAQQKQHWDQQQQTKGLPPTQQQQQQQHQQQQ
jgi:hypothetical protein